MESLAAVSEISVSTYALLRGTSRCGVREVSSGLREPQQCRDMALETICGYMMNVYMCICWRIRSGVQVKTRLHESMHGG